MIRRTFYLTPIFLFAASFTFAQQKDSTQCPLHEQHMREQATSHTKSPHLAEVNRRGEKAMGFSQSKTTHHFLLHPDGGVIQVEVNQAKYLKSRQQIRTHLAGIAQSFAAGDFQKPMQTHGEMPAGVATMQRLKSAITFTYKPTPRGGRVYLSSSNPEALAAIHEFLRYQITEHQTGDTLDVL